MKYKIVRLFIATVFCVMATAVPVSAAQTGDVVPEVSAEIIAGENTETLAAESTGTTTGEDAESDAADGSEGGSASDETETTGTYKVTFYALDDEDAYEEITVQEGKSIELSELPENPSRTDYTFAGWYTKEEDGSFEEFDLEEAIITGDTALYAQWTVNAVTGIALPESLTLPG